MFGIFKISSTFLLGYALALTVLVPFDKVHAEGFKVLHTFSGGSDGRFPLAGLIADNVGNFYGTTDKSGDPNCGQNGCGTVFRLAPGRIATVLYSFAHSKRNGADPWAGVIADQAGNFYGTTLEGGTQGCGTVFKVAPDGTETVLHAFCDGGGDGSSPRAGLIADKAGNLYGTTMIGGGRSLGAVFRLAPDRTETLLHSFEGVSDGSYPEAGLILDKGGNLYGTTWGGGTAGVGTVFRLAPDGTETVLYSFRGGSDGASPVAGLLADEAGNLFGTTMTGGGAGCYENQGCGTVFRLAPDGAETVLYSFQSGSDGAFPLAGLISDSAGYLYGTTTGCCGGSNGTVFKLAPDGTETVLHAFTGGKDGAYPRSGLIAKAGNLFGTAYAGGNLSCPGSGGGGCGTVFKLKE